jgi:hypothetical protein
MFLKIDLFYDPVISLLGISKKECKSTFKRETATPMFISTLLTIAKLWNQPRCPTAIEWVRKCGILLGHEEG